VIFVAIIIIVFIITLSSLLYGYNGLYLKNIRSFWYIFL